MNVDHWVVTCNKSSISVVGQPDHILRMVVHGRAVAHIDSYKNGHKPVILFDQVVDHLII
ncbi:hypothetical protein D3C80_1669600 [compost metagenome]